MSVTIACDNWVMIAFAAIGMVAVFGAVMVIVSSVLLSRTTTKHVAP